MNKKSHLIEERSKALGDDYALTLSDLKNQILECQQKAALAINKELIRLYWEIGKVIVEKQKTRDWKPDAIQQLAKDLQHEFPKIKGFSKANIFRMKAFFMANKKVSQISQKFEFFHILGSPLVLK